MGRTAKRAGIISVQKELFPDDLGALSQPRKATILMPGRSGLDPKLPPVHSNAKSQLIAEYISMYQMVTHGGLFIDGFSGPQKRDHEEAWTARRVLELQPKWLRHFWLCELDPSGLEPLQRLKKVHHGCPKGRTVSVMRGDFNETIKVILKSPKLRRSTPVFALLDQRNTECHWATVQAIADRAGKRKIELLYFLGTGWLQRSLSTSSTPERLREIDCWWGGNTWLELTEMSQVEVVQRVSNRFAQELGYRHVTPWPVFQTKLGRRKMFYLIHASDHDDAPRLMKRAYSRVIGSVPGTPTDAQQTLL